MHKQLLPVIAAAVAAIAASISVHAAERAPTAQLSALEGSVVMNQGKRFVPAKLDTGLFAGDRILVLKTGKATVTFADGCAVVVKPGKLMTVTDKSPCSEQAASAAQDGGMLGGDSVPGYGDPVNRTAVTVGAIVGGLGAAAGGSCLADGWPCDDENSRRSHGVSP